MPKYTPQQTLQYSTFIKRNISEALQAALQSHPDLTVRNAYIGIDFENKRFKLPAIIIKFYERKLTNAGVGHYEYLPAPTDPEPDNPTELIKYYHRFYEGDIAFEIWGQSSIDRDLVRDSLIEVLTMNDASPGGTAFLNRFYSDEANTPYGLWHFPVLNLDLVTGYGEQTQLAPWQPEDMMVYQTSYRVPTFGEFYSYTPTSPAIESPIEQVDVYPYIPGIDPTPDQNPDGPNAPGWWHFSGWPDGSTTI